MNLYHKTVNEYEKLGINLIPDKFASKASAINKHNHDFKWTHYCDHPLSCDDIRKFRTFGATNVAIPLGSYNNICVIDVDTTDLKLLEFLKKALPPSPVERIGSKGFARFYRSYPGICNYAVKDVLGNIVFEVLAKNKKITVPPSVHPAGPVYEWTNKSLTCLTSLDELPMLPPMLVTNIEHMLQADFPDTFGQPRIVNNRGASANMVNGRTDILKKKAFALLEAMDRGEPYSLEKIVEELVQFDATEHSEPLFTDLTEQGHQHTHAFTNGLKFVVNMLDYVQGKRFNGKKVYSTVNCGGYTTDEEAKIYEIGSSVKFDAKGNPKPIKNRRVQYEWD